MPVLPQLNFAPVHGFNVSFESALYRAAQIKFDLDFPGPVFTYSWPSDGNPQRYLADQDDADLSVDALFRYLRFIASALDAETQLHLVVHSLGTRVVSQSLARLQLASESYPVRPYANVVVAAGDLDRRLFEQWMELAAPITPRVTIYTTAHDKALLCSDSIRDLFSNVANDPKARVGLNDKKLGRAIFSDPNAPDRFVTVDLSDFGDRAFFACTAQNHADYAEEPEAFRDLSCVLKGDGPDAPSRTTFLTRHRDEAAKGSYWKLRKGDATAAGLCKLD